MGLSDSQNYAVQVTERVNSCFSLAGSTFIFLTFAFSSRFRKPINRLIFYAALGNAIYAIATLISIDGIAAGPNSALCQFQGFVIQMFLLADTLWNLSMAFNVYLTVFRRYQPSQLRALELRYFIINYGTPLIIALVLYFISSEEKGKVYGPALIWCWISLDWDPLRIGVLYGPAWICILCVLIIYVASGLEILRKRRQLHAFAASPIFDSVGTELDERSSAPFKTTEVKVTTELAETRVGSLSPRSFSGESNERQRSSISNIKPYEPYSVVIEKGPKANFLSPPVSSSGNMMTERPSNTALRLNHAAWDYTKCAILFFFALLVTWLPSSINRVYSLLYPEATNWPLNYCASFVLPLMGFCNFITYVVASRAAVRETAAQWRTAIGRRFGARPWVRVSRPRSLEEGLTAENNK